MPATTAKLATASAGEGRPPDPAKKRRSATVVAITLYRQEMNVLWGLAEGRRYFFPLTATYSLRMQSNFYSKWLMHLNPDWGL